MKTIILWVLQVINIILVRIAMRTRNTVDDDCVKAIDDIIKLLAGEVKAS